MTNTERTTQIRKLARLCRQGRATPEQWAECKRLEDEDYAARVRPSRPARGWYDLGPAEWAWNGDARAIGG